MYVIYVQTESRSCSELELLDGGDVYLRIHLTVMVCSTRKRKRDDQMGHRPKTGTYLGSDLGSITPTFFQAFTREDTRSENIDCLYFLYFWDLRA